MAQSGMVEGPFRAGHQDEGYHPLKVAEYLARRDTHRLETSLGQFRRAAGVALWLIPHGMHLAIDLHGQPTLEAGEIEHEATNRELSSKPEAARSSTKLLPKHHFRQGHGSAKLAGEPDVVVRSAHRAMLHPVGIDPSTILRMVHLPVPGRIFASILPGTGRWQTRAAGLTEGPLPHSNGLRLGARTGSTIVTT